VVPQCVGMTFPAHGVQYSLADYLELEATSNVKHEYLAGEIFGMAGGTPEHAALKAAVIGLLFSQIRGSGARWRSSHPRRHRR
jgi:Uma2 family endonuclease